MFCWGLGLYPDSFNIPMFSGSHDLTLLVATCGYPWNQPLRLRFRCANADLSRRVSSWSGHGRHGAPPTPAILGMFMETTANYLGLLRDEGIHSWRRWAHPIFTHPNSTTIWMLESARVHWMDIKPLELCTCYRSWTLKSIGRNWTSRLWNRVLVKPRRTRQTKGSDVLNLGASCSKLTIPSVFHGWIWLENLSKLPFACSDGIIYSLKAPSVAVRSGKKQLMWSHPLNPRLSLGLLDGPVAQDFEQPHNIFLEWFQ